MMNSKPRSAALIDEAPVHAPSGPGSSGSLRHHSWPQIRTPHSLRAPPFFNLFRIWCAFRTWADRMSGVVRIGLIATDLFADATKIAICYERAQKGTSPSDVGESKAIRQITVSTEYFFSPTIAVYWTVKYFGHRNQLRNHRGR